MRNKRSTPRLEGVALARPSTLTLAAAFSLQREEHREGARRAVGVSITRALLLLFAFLGALLVKSGRRVWRLIVLSTARGRSLRLLFVRAAIGGGATVANGVLHSQLIALVGRHDRAEERFD